MCGHLLHPLALSEQGPPYPLYDQRSDDERSQDSDPG
jgi:hypothetical protein